MSNWEKTMKEWDDSVPDGIKYLSAEKQVLMRRVRELESENARLKDAQRWRVVANGELPEDGEVVLAAFENREILTATYYKHHEGFGGVENYWHIEGWHSGNVTHWMTLPESPNDTQTDTVVYGKESEE